MRRDISSLKLSIKPPELDEVLEGIKSVLSSGQLTLGQEVKHLEEEFAQFVGVPFAAAVNSGTAALEIALRAFGVAGKEVLLPTNTFFATAAAVIHAGGTPRFVDCDPFTLAMDYRSLVYRWRMGCAGVIVVHIGGPVVPCIQEVRRFCRERDLFLLEDAAHAHGSSLQGRQAGTFGDAAAFSFYPTKVMTSAEGGMVVTADETIYREALVYRDQGKENFSSNFHIRLGYNWRMSELHAVLGRAQLRRLPDNIVRRQEIAHWYYQMLQRLPQFTVQFLPEGSASNYYKFPLFLPKRISRAELKQRLKAEWGISLSGGVYDLPCHDQPVFRGYANGDFPVAEQDCGRHICLPLYPGLSRAEVEYVVEALEVTVNSMLLEV